MLGFPPNNCIMIYVFVIKCALKEKRKQTMSHFDALFDLSSLASFFVV